MTKYNLHTNNNTTGCACGAVLTRTTIIADPFNGLAFFMFKNSMQKEIMINSGCVVLTYTTGIHKIGMSEQRKKTVLKTLTGL